MGNNEGTTCTSKSVDCVQLDEGAKIIHSDIVPFQITEWESDSMPNLRWKPRQYNSYSHLVTLLPSFTRNVCFGQNKRNSESEANQTSLPETPFRLIVPHMKREKRYCYES